MSRLRIKLEASAVEQLIILAGYKTCENCPIVQLCQIIVMEWSFLVRSPGFCNLTLGDVADMTACLVVEYEKIDFDSILHPKYNLCFYKNQKNMMVLQYDPLFHMKQLAIQNTNIPRKLIL